MRLDKYSNPVFTDTDLFDLLYKNTKLCDNLMVEYNDEIKQLEEISELQFIKYEKIEDLTVEDYDIECQKHWYMPEKYYDFNVKEYCLQFCETEEQINRVNQELVEFEKRNLMRLLQWLKYFVDMCNENNIIYGVGRGSSCASYVLYLLKVHRIDSIKYELDYKEFLREGE